MENYPSVYTPLEMVIWLKDIPYTLEKIKKIDKALPPATVDDPRWQNSANNLKALLKLEITQVLEVSQQYAISLLFLAGAYYHQYEKTGSSPSSPYLEDRVFKAGRPLNANLHYTTNTHIIFFLIAPDQT